MSTNYKAKLSRKLPRTGRHTSQDYSSPSSTWNNCFEYSDITAIIRELENTRNEKRILRTSRKGKHKSSRIRMVLDMSTFKTCILDHTYVFIQDFQVLVLGEMATQIIKFVIFPKQLNCEFSKGMDPVFMHMFMFLEQCLKRMRGSINIYEMNKQTRNPYQFLT